MTLAELVSRVRAQRGLSRAQLALMAHAQRQFIFDIETGAYANLKVASIVNLAKALRVEPEMVLLAAINSMDAARANDEAAFQKGDTSG